MPLALQSLCVVASQFSWLQRIAFDSWVALMVAPHKSQMVLGPGLDSTSPDWERRALLDARSSSFPALSWKRKQSAGRLLPPCKNTSVGWILVSGDAVEHAVVQFEHAVVQCLNVQ